MAALREPLTRMRSPAAVLRTNQSAASVWEAQ